MAENEPQTPAARSVGALGDDTLSTHDGTDLLSGNAGSAPVTSDPDKDLAGDTGGANVTRDGYNLEPDDLVPVNLLSGGLEGAAPLSQWGEAAGWTTSNAEGAHAVTREVATEHGEAYTISVELAANLAGGAAGGSLQVLWDKEIVGTINVTSGVFESHRFDVTGTGGHCGLAFREMPISGHERADINMDGSIFSYTWSVSVGGEQFDVAAFVPGQSRVFQMIDGQLTVFDPDTEKYQAAGPPTGLQIDAIGFSSKDDLLYGISKANGIDATGAAVTARDLVMVDAHGKAYRVGETPVGDYVGDFDDVGNLWAFQSNLNRVTRIDVNTPDAGGNPLAQHYDLPNGLFAGRTYDVTYSAKEGVFYAVESPGRNSESGAVHKINLSGLAEGGAPEVSSVPITATLFDEGMSAGMPKGTYGAVFMDGEGNLFFGLSQGSHDLQDGAGTQGAFYEVEVDWTEGTAYAKFIAAAQSTDGSGSAVDPRAASPFSPIDTAAHVLIRDPAVVSASGGMADLHGDGGADHLWGGDWWGDGDADAFVGAAGDGHKFDGFEADHDVIDLRSYGIEYSDLEAHFQNHDGGTVIDLSALTGGAITDKLILKAVDPNDLDESNFLL